MLAILSFIPSAGFTAAILISIGHTSEEALNKPNPIRLVAVDP